MIRTKELIAAFTIAILISGCSTEPKRPASEKSTSPTEAAASGPDTRRVILAFGDSLTSGLGVDPAENYPSKLQRRIDYAGLNYRVVNSGVSGDTSAQGLNRLDAVLAQNPRVVILCLGANDGLRGYPVDATQRNLEQIIVRLQEERVKIVLAGILLPPNFGPFFTKEFREIFPHLARKYGLALVPFLLEGVAGIPDLNLPDGIHPNAEGYERVAENVWAVLKPMLR